MFWLMEKNQAGEIAGAVIGNTNENGSHVQTKIALREICNQALKFD